MSDFDNPAFQHPPRRDSCGRTPHEAMVEVLLKRLAKGVEAVLAVALAHLLLSHWALLWSAYWAAWEWLTPRLEAHPWLLYVAMALGAFDLLRRAIAAINARMGRRA